MIYSGNYQEPSSYLQKSTCMHAENTIISIGVYSPIHIQCVRIQIIITFRGKHDVVYNKRVQSQYLPKPSIKPCPLSKPWPITNANHSHVSTLPAGPVHTCINTQTRIIIYAYMCNAVHRPSNKTTAVRSIVSETNTSSHIHIVEQHTLLGGRTGLDVHWEICETRYNIP